MTEVRSPPARSLTSGLKGHDSPVRNACRNAAKYGYLAWLIAATVSGALVDLGLPFFAFAALACSRVVSSFAASNRTGLAGSTRVFSVESGPLNRLASGLSISSRIQR
jgi:hypothetical protein